jgi:type VI secretion system protein ImpJ
MNKPQKVVWTKGMFLMPQHFQAQEEYFEQALHFRASASNFANWGFSRLGVDEASLANGLFTLRYCEGIFPDGLTFQADLIDDLPLSRPVEEFYSAAKSDHLDVYLASPQMRSSAKNFVLGPRDNSKDSPVRYAVANREVTDATLGSDEKTIQVAIKSLRVLFEGENMDGFTALRVARIIQTPAGTYALKVDFVPPLLDILASDYLLNLTRRQVEVMTAKGASLSLTRRQKSGDLADFTNSEAADFWFLHTINSYLPEIDHIRKVRRGHPEVLYRAMLRLGGALTTFALNESVRDLPDYDHDDLGRSFTELDAQIRKLLEIVRQSKCIVVPLQKTDRFIWKGSIQDDRQLDATHFILSVNSAVPVEELVSKFQRLAKVSSPDELTRLIRMALPGVGLRHLSGQIPASVPINLSCQYFSLSTTGPQWNNIMQARALSVFVPAEISEPKMELLTVLP